MQTVPSELRSHDEHLNRLESRVESVAALAWGEVDPERISESWEAVIPPVAAEVSRAQSAAATSGVTSTRNVTVATGQYQMPTAFVDPSPLVGYGSTGVPLEDALYGPAIGTKSLIGRGMPTRDAMTYGLAVATSLSRTLVADVGRQSAHLDMIARAITGYVRVVEAGACRRCIILAGKWFRWNDGFLRHPRCRCEHMPAKSKEWAVDEGWYADPYEAFHSMSREEQEATWGRSEARAIRDGADIFQVTNSTTIRTRGSTPVSWDGMTTTEGTTRRGNYGARGTGRQRLTPDAIYRTAGTRTNALRMLEENGYILPGGQNPTGVLRGAREAFGALGGGGARRAASNAVMEARRTGIRDPNNRYTMTEAERRRHDADRDWQMVRAGINPYQAGAAQRWEALKQGGPAPRGGSLPRPLTDNDRARAEAAYRRFTLGLDGGDPALKTTR